MEQKILIRVVIFLVSLLFALLLFNCSPADEALEARQNAGNVTYTITTVNGACVESGLYSLAIVDAVDMEKRADFACSVASDRVSLTSAAVLEIRVFKQGFEFDRTVLYTVVVSQNGTDTTYANVDYRGVKYVVK
jgi:hypothetical protein